MRKMEFEHVVAAVDFSEPSRIALREAGRIAQEAGARLTALHVLDDESTEVFEQFLDGDSEPLTQALKEELAKWLAAEVPESVTTAIELSTGSASRELSNQADLLEGDLMVLGAWGLGGHKRRMGTVASNFVRQAAAPAFLISRTAGKHETVVACIDYSEVSDGVMRQAIALARFEDADLDLVHAVAPPQAYYTEATIAGLEQFGPIGPDPEHLAKLRRGHECQLEQFAAHYESDLADLSVNRYIVEEFSAARAILQHLGQVEAPVLVLGAHGRGSFREFLLGTTAERILHEAPCSGLLIRGEKPQKSRKLRRNK